MAGRKLQACVLGDRRALPVTFKYCGLWVRNYFLDVLRLAKQQGGVCVLNTREIVKREWQVCAWKNYLILHNMLH